MTFHNDFEYIACDILPELTIAEYQRMRPKKSGFARFIARIFFL